jgi:hypothetical protein
MTLLAETVVTHQHLEALQSVGAAEQTAVVTEQQVEVVVAEPTVVQEIYPAAQEHPVKVLQVDKETIRVA